MIVSPGFAGIVVTPANVPAFAAKLKSRCVATAWFPGHTKTAGLYWPEVTVNAALVPEEFVTITAAGPGLTSGATN